MKIIPISKKKKDYDNSKSGTSILWEKITSGTSYPSILTILTNLAYIVNQNKSIQADVYIEPANMFEFGTFTTPDVAPTIIKRGYDEAKRQIDILKETDPLRFKQLQWLDPIPVDDPSLQTDLNFRVVATSPPHLVKRKFGILAKASVALSIFTFVIWVLQLKLRYGSSISVRKLLLQKFLRLYRFCSRMWKALEGKK